MTCWFIFFSEYSWLAVRGDAFDSSTPQARQRVSQRDHSSLPKGGIWSIRLILKWEGNPASLPVLDWELHAKGPLYVIEAPYDGIIWTDPTRKERKKKKREKKKRNSSWSNKGIGSSDQGHAAEVKVNVKDQRSKNTRSGSKTKDKDQMTRVNKHQRWFLQYLWLDPAADLSWQAWQAIRALSGFWSIQDDVCKSLSHNS